MNKKVILSLAVLLAGFSTTAYADSYYSGDRFYTGNINGASVSATTYTQAPGRIVDNSLNSLGRGAELFIKNRGNHKHFGSLNINYGRVKAKTETRGGSYGYGNVSYNYISATAFGALTSIDSKGSRNMVWNMNKNKGRVSAETWTRASNNVKENEIYTTAVGALTVVESKGSHNKFSLKNGNWAPVSATTTTKAWNNVKDNDIYTTAVGAQTSLESKGHGNYGHIFNINDGNVRAQTNTMAENKVKYNTIATTAIGAAVSIDDTKKGGHRRGRHYYSPSNHYGSLNLNFGNVAAQTNTRGYSVIGNTINTTAVGASTSITSNRSRR